jgi:CRP/FNR family cyclic AMP-dependent transcriptional regulator
MPVREILDFCVGGIRRNVPAGTLVLHEGGRSGHLFVLIEGRLDVVKSDTIVASVSEQGAVFGEMSVLLDKPHTATVRAAADSIVYEINDAASFLRQQPAMIGDILHSMINLPPLTVSPGSDRESDPRM